VRDVFAFRLDDSEPALDEIRVAFAAEWTLHLEQEGVISDFDIDAFFNILTDHCNILLDCAIAEQVLSAHEAQSAARHKVVLGRLDALSRQLAAASKAKSGDVSGRVTSLRRAISQRYSMIQPPSVSGRRRVALDELYVTPAFRSRNGFGRTDLPNLLGTLSRVVILGDPGAGKSTLGAKFSALLTADGPTPTVMGREVLPWPVELRKYAANNENLTTPLLEYFAAWAKGSYSVAMSEPDFCTLLERGELLVIFDGLDELLDTSMRVAVRDVVESFCVRFPRAPVLVTSRRVGYPDAPLDDAMFDTWELERFDKPRVDEYATKWFEFELSDEPANERKARTAAFLHESETAPDLRTNPLLLALLCSSYRDAGYIPSNLPDVYDNCATLPFSTWDRSRQIDVLLPFAEHVRPALRELAWWIFTNSNLGVGVTRRQAIEKTTTYLQLRRFSDEDRARAAAGEFVDFCRGRAWVFSEQGTTASGEPLYGFTHRTFLEFFCAERLAFRNQTPPELVSELMPKIASQAWDVVAQIALQIKARSYDGGADDVLHALYSEVRTRQGVELVSSVDFLLRFMQVVVPSPVISKGLGANLLKLPAGMWRAAAQRDTARTLLSRIEAVGAEVREEMAKGVAESEAAMLSSREPQLVALASELLLQGSGSSRTSDPARAFWRAARSEFARQSGDLLATVAEENATVAIDWYLAVDARTRLLATHGVWVALAQRRLLLAERWRASALVRAQSLPVRSQHDLASSLLLRELGAAWTNRQESPLPTAREWRADPEVLNLMAKVRGPLSGPTDSDELWGLYLVCAGTFEWIFSAERSLSRVAPWAGVLGKAPLPQVRALGQLCQHRLDRTRPDSSLGLDELFGVPLAGDMMRWVSGSRRLVIAR